MIPNGELFITRDVYNKASVHTLITAGSGHIVKNLKKQDLPHYSDADSIPALHRHIAHTLKNMNLTKLTPSIFWIATAVTTGIPLQPISIPK